MNKKAIAILGAIFLLIVGTLGFLIYSKYSSSSSKSSTSSSSTDVATTTGADLTPVENVATSTAVADQTIVKLVEDQVVSPVLFYNGLGITYFDNSGNLYQVSFQEENGLLTVTQKKKLDVPVKSGISKVLWPQTGNDFIAEIKAADGTKTWSYFNSNTASYVDLPAQVESVDWMPSGDKIMYVWLENGKATLNTSDPDTKNWKSLADMWETDDILHVSPDGQQVLYYETGNTSADNPINLVSIDGKIWKSMVKTGLNSGVLWSPDGQKFLFGKKDAATQKYQLWVYNISSGEVKSLGLYTTVEKAAWDKDSNVIYASVPDSGIAGGTSLTVDTFYRLDISTMDRKSYVNTAGISIDGQNLFLNSTADKLFFRNAQDGALYYLDLTK